MSAVQHVHSADGTQIAYRASGRGDPLVLVHGSGTSGSDWLFALPHLREEFTVVTMDRRGRGDSGDGTDYAIEREAEDILAVLEAVDGELLVGHSFGAICAVAAAARTDRLRRLVLYEPPIGVQALWVTALAEVVAAGDLDAALGTFLAGAGVRPVEIRALRSSPTWGVLLDSVPSIPRELGAVPAWVPPREPVEVPVLFLAGDETDSPAYFDRLDDLLSAFPALRRETISGQKHIAHILAAEEFAGLVADFVSQD